MIVEFSYPSLLPYLVRSDEFDFIIFARDVMDNIPFSGESYLKSLNNIWLALCIQNYLLRPEVNHDSCFNITLLRMRAEFISHVVFIRISRWTKI